MTVLRPLYRAVTVLLCAAWLSACASSPDPRTLTFPPLSIDEPDIQVTRLSNGITLYLLPDPSLPLIRISALIHAGSRYTDSASPAVTGLTGSMLRLGGVGDTLPDELDDSLDFAAIQMGGGIGQSVASAHLNTLTRHLPQALALFADMLRRPRFDSDRLTTQKDAVIESIRRKNDRPGGIVRREFAKLLFGPDHPAGYDPTHAEIETIQRDDLIATHQAFYAPERIRLGIIGNLPAAQMIAAVEAAFGDWQAEPAVLAVPTPLPTDNSHHIAFAHRDISQASLRIGHLSIRRDHPDYYALALANRILGQGYQSRLFNQVRTRHALAYSVGSVLSAGQIDRGYFAMGARTRGEKVGETLKRMFAEVERLRNERVPEAELAATKESFLNAFLFKSITPDQVLSRRMYLDYYQMPKDELIRLRERTLAVTAEDILRVAQQHLNPDRMSIVAVGRRDDLLAPLSAYGPVREIALEEP